MSCQHSPLERVNLTSGGTAVAEAGGPTKLGRIYMVNLDALGEPINIWHAIRDPATDTQLVGNYITGEGYFDVPPGQYDVVFSFGTPVRRSGVVVRAGAVVPVTGGN